MRLLLEGGAAVDLASNVGATPLYVACRNGHAECARLLLVVAGAAVDLAMNDGATPLLTACYKGHTKCTRLLLKAKADMTLRNKFGETALMLACRFGQTDVAQRLLGAADAHRDRRDQRGWQQWDDAGKCAAWDAARV